MKTERRHELETNELATIVGDSVERAKPYMTLIAGLLIAAIVIGGIYLYLRQQSIAQQAAAWDLYFDRSTTGDQALLADLGNQYPATPVGNWSRLMAANIELNEAVELLFRDRSDAAERIEIAIEQYEAVIDSAREPLLIQLALLGLGRAQESLGFESSTHLDDALETYRKLLEDHPDSPGADLAKRRIAELERPQNREFYDWFAQQTPAPPAQPPGMEMFPFDNLDQLPDGPPADSGPLLNTSPPGQAPTDEAPAEEAATPAETDATPAADAEPAATDEAASPAAESSEAQQP